MRGFKLGSFEVKLHVKGNTFIGDLFDNGENKGFVTSQKSHFDCALKGFAYLRMLNDMPSNYEYLPDMGALCLQ